MQNKRVIVRSDEDSSSGNNGGHKQTERKGFFKGVGGSVFPFLVPGEVVLDLNAVLRVTPQKKSLQIDNDNDVSRVKLAACRTRGGNGQAGKKAHVRVGANLPLCKRCRGMCAPASQC